MCIYFLLHIPTVVWLGKRITRLEQKLYTDRMIGWDFSSISPSLLFVPTREVLMTITDVAARTRVQFEADLR